VREDEFECGAFSLRGGMPALNIKYVNLLEKIAGEIMTRGLKLLALVVLAFSMLACNQSGGGGNQQQTGGAKKIKIGFAMDTLKEERWVRDRDAFKKRCDELGVDCIVTVADGVAERQAADVDTMLTQNIDVLVIAAHDATQAVSMVDKAKAKGIPVISYDRLINSDKIDLYISHQVPVIGQKMAEYALQHVPKGNYVLINGAPTDNNASIMEKSEMAVLKPAIDRGDIKIVAEESAKDWLRDEALKIMENALIKGNNDIQAVIAQNDGTAQGAIGAIETKGLAGKILVTGQDAEKASLQSIAEGKQTMTVYKPIIPLASGAVEAAIKLAKKEPLTGTTMFMNDKLNKEVPAILLEVITVDKSNMMDTIIKDGFQTYDEVYKNVPADQRPPKQ
jgi:D-xylose transport system substrate-binding protein